jgi:hypothetical protein
VIYDFILKKKKKGKEIEDAAQHNVGFSKFVQSLSAVS